MGTRTAGTALVSVMAASSHIYRKGMMELRRLVIILPRVPQRQSTDSGQAEGETSAMRVHSAAALNLYRKRHW